MTYRTTDIDDSPDLFAVTGDAVRQSGVAPVLLDRAASLGVIERSRPNLLVVDLRLGEDSVAPKSSGACDSTAHFGTCRSSSALPQSISAMRTPRGSRIPVPPRVLRKPFSLAELESAHDDALGRDDPAMTVSRQPPPD